jgi:hypothetical protein
MNKGHVTLLLADYLDGLLSPEETASVKKHLAECAECREEHRFLKAYRKEAASFPRVPVPDDFLEKIHARIDAPARGGLLRALFVPLKIKLPLEAAGALALTVLAVFIFKPFGERKLEYRAEAPAVSEQATPEQRADREPSRARGGTMIAKDESKPRKELVPLMEKKDSSPTDTDRITVANGAESAKTAATDDTSVTGVADMSLVLAAVRPEGEAPGTRGASRSRSVPSDMITSLQEKRAYDARSGAVSSEYAKSAETSAEGRSRVDVIMGQATALGGRVIRTLDPVVVEIPAKNYARFLAGIRSAWSVRQQTPSAPPARAGRLRLTLSLQQ